MRKFERIQVEKGQAYIRDTGIAVLNIVHQLSDGQSLYDLLQAYPDLSDEDVVEALIYTVDDLTGGIVMVMHDSRAPIASIASAGIILRENAPQLNEAQKENIAHIISSTAQRLNSMWRYFADWVHVKYLLRLITPEKTSLATILEEVKSDWNNTGVKGAIEVIIPDELPPIHTSGYLSQVFTGLLMVLFPMTPQVKHGGQIVIAKTNQNDLSIQIIREFELPKPASVDIEKFVWDRLEVSLAVLILRSHQSDLQIYASDTLITFEFSLPIWKENT